MFQTEITLYIEIILTNMNTFIGFGSFKRTQQAAKWSYRSKKIRIEKTPLEIQLVRPTEVCGKVKSENNG